MITWAEIIFKNYYSVMAALICIFLKTKTRGQQRNGVEMSLALENIGLDAFMIKVCHISPS